jgi:hypothetical protein
MAHPVARHAATRVRRLSRMASDHAGTTRRDPDRSPVIDRARAVVDLRRVVTAAIDLLVAVPRAIDRPAAVPAAIDLEPVRLAIDLVVGRMVVGRMVVGRMVVGPVAGRAVIALVVVPVACATEFRHVE